jgi:hypothetical protein
MRFHLFYGFIGDPAVPAVLRIEWMIRRLIRITEVLINASK